ncbi:MAG: 2-oxoglutarate and iron-dependent oxygenase domain-containing protein [Alphaproteobacteria bacterium]|jgi:isopenicillin N synthase-like dioxygenase|nr:2-oxoglutarate and iron-dependent oxygenase domain-containing protein [Alphaproteobacteria bacterium]
MGIPAIDISPFLAGDPVGKRRVADAVAATCRESGFLVISGHGLPAEDLDRAFGLTRDFMDLPQERKDRWHPSGPAKQRGYHAFATRGLAYTLDQEIPPDLRETLFLGPVDDHQAVYAGQPDALAAYWPNTIPTEPDGLDAALVAIYRGFERLAADMLRIFAVALDMPEDHFADKIDRHFSILSCHHYPALQEPPLPGQLRTGEHTDFGAMTLLAMTEAAGGLEARLPEGAWVPVQARPGELAVNLGDMMARWTNDRWTSTLHRVVNPPNLEDAMSRRQSIGYFMHPNYDTLIECIPTCLDAGEAPIYPTITAGEHIAMKIEKSHGVAPAA